jgi:hypothetical protein
MCSILERIKRIYLSCVEAFSKDPSRRALYESKTVWDLLAAEGNHPLIATLRRVEQKEPGYQTVIIPERGWSTNKEIDDAVNDWLKTQGVNAWSPSQEITELERSLHPHGG